MLPGIVIFGRQPAECWNRKMLSLYLVPPAIPLPDIRIILSVRGALAISALVPPTERWGSQVTHEASGKVVTTGVFGTLRDLIRWRFMHFGQHDRVTFSSSANLVTSRLSNNRRQEDIA